MPYRKGTSKTWFMRVTATDGRRLVCCTDTTLERTARDMEAWVRGLRERLDPHSVLDAIVDQRVTLPQAWRLQEDGVRKLLAERLAKKLDADLAPLLNEWVRIKTGSARGAVSAERYRLQIERLFPGAFLRSSLTTPRIAHALDALPVKDPTRNRYRAALSGFCKWLVRRGVLETNPAREVGGYSEHEGRETWYERDVAERVILAITDVSYRGREALMCGTGADWSDVDRLTVADIDFKAGTVRCYGSKTKWRNRVVRITEAWVIPHVKAALSGKLPTAKVFDSKHDTALLMHHAAVKAVGAPASRLHDWRHTYAVNALRKGQPATVVARQLGHRDAHLVWTRYGRFIPDDSDYIGIDVTDSTTDSATDLKKRKEN